MKRPADRAAYVSLVERALNEVIDLRASIESDEAFVDGPIEIIDRLESQLRDHLNAVRQPQHLYGGPDLPFMDIVDSAPRAILPFAGLLHLINETQRQGLEPD